VKIIFITLGFVFSSIVFSSDHSHDDHHHHHSDDSEMAMGPGGANEVINGVIKKIKKETSILIIDHEKIPSINMDAMVMPFKVADKKLFEGLKEDQKIGFKFRLEDNKFVIYEIYTK
jgi:Cu/Ag efflux protein CusF